MNEFNIIQSCNDLSYEVMKACFVNQAFHLLGDAPPKVLQQQWIKLSSEFYMLSDDPAIRTYIEEYSEVVYLDSRIYRTRVLVATLQKTFSFKLLQSLKDLGYSYPFTPATYLNDLDRVVKKTNNMQSRVKMLLNEIGRKQVQGESEPVTMAMFDAKLIQIERVFKVPINPEHLTAQMFALKIKEFREYVEKLETEKQEDNG